MLTRQDYFSTCYLDKTLTIKGENCHGGNLSKMSLTALLSTSADRSEKLTPLLIDTAKNPTVSKM